MTKYRTYSREAFNNLKNIADASRGAYKSADAAWQEARSALVTASAWADKLLNAQRLDGAEDEVKREDVRREEAQREVAAAHAEVQRTAAVRQAAECSATIWMRS